MQLPSNLLLNYCGRPSWYLGFFIIAWGLVSAVTSQVKSFGGLLACRFILGITGENERSVQRVDSRLMISRGTILPRCIVLSLKVVLKEGAQ